MARPQKNGKKNFVTQSLDSKISKLVHDLLNERPGRSVRDITVFETLKYVQSHDLSLQRMKKILLEKSIQKALVLIEADEIENGYASNNSVVEIQNRTDLVEVEDSNAMNNTVVNLWNIKPASKAATANESLNSVTESPKKKYSTVAQEAVIKNEAKENKERTRKRTKEPSISGLNKRQKVDKDRSPPNASLSQLGGMDEIITDLLEVIGIPILHPEIYLSTGVEPPRGVLLHGPPGCGKTTIANCLAGDLKVPFLSVSAPSIVSGMSGESEKKIRELFEEARSLAPCLIFLDEIDSITPKRDGAQREMEKRIVAQLLTCIDELSMEKTNNKPVIIIAATNRPDAIDPALRRAGRFDREICLNVPSEESRGYILKSITKNLKISGDFDYKKLAKMTPGYVGADLKALATAAGLAAIKRIFCSLSAAQNETESKIEDVEIMDIDDINEQKENNERNENKDQNHLETQNILKETKKKSLDDTTQLSNIQNFLLKYSKPLKAHELQGLSVEFDDFLTALPTIQPTAKREGFATVPDVTWSSVGALSKVRIELHMSIVQPIKRPELYERVGITVPGGVLLWGPPGCGKTLLAKAVANESHANFISIKGPELLNKYVGESEKAVRQVFTRARASVPCIIFFDELDALIPKRDASLSESSSRVVNTLLTELDGLNDRKGIYVIGATNRPDMIDPAMLRPGRLDKTLFIELPNSVERFDILKAVIRTHNTPLSKDVDLERIANDERCKNFSGADIAALVREAGIMTLKKKFYTNISKGDESIEKELSDEENEIEVTAIDFDNALKNVKPSVTESDRMKYKELSQTLDN
ncbi:putative AAA family ATPase RIX7 [Ascoidea rubescens DSM 1968]|uniref:Ribosome biogenesis ATPase RIX7 n=1 Tax=Ascoidea rubescens DSM 1968 TaxID=1344418 RepID=A0A1D2VL57_9ASCO|nr:ribosome biogenesis ATPase RIX7 [Ascoidea rubescens DSM 1968]ODV62333.1 ribosome biogenesis ATPase RIX7 [Ascoidea rubescens DSM 1968]